VSGAVNVPVSDTLGVRASGFDRWEPGYIDNVQTGARGVNGTQIGGAHLSALWRPLDILSVRLSALFEDNKQSGEPYVMLGAGLGDLQQAFMLNAGRSERKFQAYSATATAKVGGQLVRNLPLRGLAATLILTASSCIAAPVDFSGVWERYPPVHDPALTPEAIFVEGAPMPGAKPRLREPFATQYEALEKKTAAAEESGHPLADTGIRCLPSGVPAMMTAILPLEIVQRRNELLILAEELAEIRRIYINEKMPPAEVAEYVCDDNHYDVDAAGSVIIHSKPEH
jgi:hypothetical protein